MTQTQIRAANNIVNEFKRKYPNAKVVVKESGNCFVDGYKVINFNSIISETDKNNDMFFNKMVDFYERMDNGSDIDLSTEKTYAVILEHQKKNVKYLGKKDDNEYVFQEISTAINPAANNKYYLTKKEVKDIFKEYV